MSAEVSEVVEVRVPLPERADGDGVCPGGITGEIDTASMMDRAKRLKGYQERLDFRECIPCDRCGNCLEMRRFTKGGEEKVMALYCLIGEMEVTPYHTCNNARRTRNNRKKVVYYLENAPAGFKVTAERIRAEVPYSGPGMDIAVEPSMPPDGYRGGEGWYRRVDGGEKGKKMPKPLMN